MCQPNKFHTPRPTIHPEMKKAAEIDDNQLSTFQTQLGKQSFIFESNLKLLGSRNNHSAKASLQRRHE